MRRITNEAAALQRKHDALGSGNQILEQRKGRLEADIEALTGERDRVRREKEEAERGKASADEARDRAEDEQRKAESEAKTAAGDLVQVRVRLASAEEKLGSVQAQAGEAERRRDEAKTAAERWEDEAADSEAKASEWRARIEDARRATAIEEGKRDALVAEQATLQASIEVLEQTLADLDTRIATSRGVLDGIGQETGRHRETLNELLGRLASLEEQIRGAQARKGDAK